MSRLRNGAGNSSGGERRELFLVTSWTTKHVMGGVANDRVFNTVELYFDGLIDKAEAIERLRYEKPNIQACLRTERALNGYLHFEGSESV